MQAVGRIGSYISKSVYTVSGPFHPFGGAVDIIVVEQPDGSYKSSPWYVRFGKFQGVLKSKENVVDISVNDVDVDFHMHLDHKGEAFFLGEVDVEESESAFSPPSSSGEDMESLDRNRRTLKSKSCNFDGNWSDSNGSERKAVSRANSRRSQFLGLVFGRRASAEGFQVKEDASGVVRTESVELAEFTADLLDLKWSTNLPSPKSKNKDDNVLLRSSSETLKDGVYKKTRMEGSSFNDATTAEENGVGMKCETSEYIIKTTTSVESVREDSTLSNSEPSDVHVSSVSIFSEVAKSDSQILDSVEKLNGLSDIQQCLGKEDQFRFVHEEKMSVSGGTTNGSPESIVTECYSQLVCVHQTNDPLKDISSITAPIVSSSSYSTCSTIDEGNILSQRENPESSEGPLSDPACTRVAEEELLLFGEMEGLASTNAKHADVSHSNHVEKETNSVISSRDVGGSNESIDAKLRSNYSLDQSIINDYLNDADIQRTRLCSASSDACIIESVNEESRELPRMASSLPIIGPLSENLVASSDSDKNHQTLGDQATAGDVKILMESKDEPAHRTIGRVASLDSLEGSRSNSPFPFQRTRGIKVSNADMNGTDHSNGIKTLDIPCDLDRGTEATKVKVIKKKVRTLTPTSDQLASLNLKEGKNTVIFTFSTSMLGKQQVDARIFLWRWDARIVISDVDGTITRSDLLGQVMPLVGMDWSQTGVAHLFSAIKDNGYQLIFLSARSISQSFITRQFLFNIKQDGKALPEGPVVISPDGLFPSLFREVVRRAPHEFKIACLEDIKALFPPGSHPFYAGFGNRDTDEVSYLKVGIPMGKIFIINPKGEIAVNRRVDTKSYSSLHDLVHGMFPLMSTCEQEDFNTWNYWKLPPLTLNL